jgi:hypothetical protein
MPQDYGSQAPAPHVQHDLREPARYLVVLPAGDSVVARLFLADRQQVAEFAAGSEEVGSMTHEVVFETGASDAIWDQALAGHSKDERAAAKVYTLEV